MYKINKDKLMEKKKTRIVTKVGDVFCIEIDSLYKQFFQFVAIDMSQLNSSVVRVFMTKYPNDYKPVIEDIVQDDVWFYAHVVLKFGIQDGLWYKCGKSKNVGDTEHIAFRLTSEFDISCIDKSYNWYVWFLNKENVHIGELKGKYKDYDLGLIFSPKSFVGKIRYGEFPIKYAKVL